jgi:glycine/D-amino acid oxidase-like deaminating enzyme
LWTAYYLQKRNPDLSIIVIDKNVAGFGASGRNGGWASALFPQSTSSLVKTYGFGRAKALRNAMVETISEIGRVVAAEKINCDWVHKGTIVFARSALQEKELRKEVAETTSLGIDKLEWWDAGRVAAGGAHGATFTPDCARLHPAKLVDQMAKLVESRGARIVERTTVTSWTSGVVQTDRGTVRAKHIINATEGYGASIKQTHRRILPLYSLMIATEPFPEKCGKSSKSNTVTRFRMGATSSFTVNVPRTIVSRSGVAGLDITGARPSSPNTTAWTESSII